jgi:hypothetical protein
MFNMTTSIKTFRYREGKVKEKFKIFHDDEFCDICDLPGIERGLFPSE